jgi:uncharacterized membrane protein YkoI
MVHIQTHKKMKTSKLLVIAVISAGLSFGVTAQAHEEKEEHVNLKDLPEAVQKTMKEKAGDNEIIRIEKEARKGKTVYEAVIKKDGKEWGLAVDENGKYLGKHNEAKEHKGKGEQHGD